MRIAPADVAAAKEPGNGSDNPSGGGATTRAEEQGTPGMVKGKSIWQSMHQMAQSAAETITVGLVGRKAPPAPKNPISEDEAEESHMDAHNILLVARLKVFARTAKNSLSAKQSADNGLFLPDSAFRYTWDFINLCFLGYTIFEIPYSMVFLDPNTCAWTGHMIFNLIVDVFFLADIACTVNTCILDEYGAIVTDRTVIINKYVTSWFFFDLLSSFPIEALLCAAGVDMGEQAGTLRILKAFRFLKLARLLKIMRVLKKWDTLAGSSSVTTFVKLFQFISVMVGLAHISACAWYGISQMSPCYVDIDAMLYGGVTVACSESSEGNVVINWLSRYDPELYAAEGRPESKYLASLYFTVVTLSTVGYGDITPVSDTERAYAVFLALGGAMVFAFCVGSISSLAAQANQTEAFILESNHSIQDFLNYARIPRALAARAKRQHAYVSKIAPHKVHHCLDDLPRHTRNQVVWNAMQDAVQTVPFFQRLDLDCRARILELVRPVSFSKGDIIYNACDVGTEMYWITSGVVDFTDLNGNIVSKMKPGELFGEMCMFPSLLSVRHQTAKARTAVELLDLSLEDFEKHVRPWFPDVYQTIGDMAIEHLSFLDGTALKKALGERSAQRCAILEQQAGFYRSTQKQLKRRKTTLVTASTAALGLTGSPQESLSMHINAGVLRPPSPSSRRASLAGRGDSQGAPSPMESGEGGHSSLQQAAGAPGVADVLSSVEAMERRVMGRLESLEEQMRVVSQNLPEDARHQDALKLYRHKPNHMDWTQHWHDKPDQAFLSKDGRRPSLLSKFAISSRMGTFGGSSKKNVGAAAGSDIKPAGSSPSETISEPPEANGMKEASGRATP